MDEIERKSETECSRTTDIIKKETKNVMKTSNEIYANKKNNNMDKGADIKTEKEDTTSYLKDNMTKETKEKKVTETTGDIGKNLNNDVQITPKQKVTILSNILIYPSTNKQTNINRKCRKNMASVLTSDIWLKLVEEKKRKEKFNFTKRTTKEETRRGHAEKDISYRNKWSKEDET